MQTVNYNRLMESAMADIPAGAPLLLHACCGPCSTAVLERLAGHFAVTLYYDNPNIWPREEYLHRRDEQRRLLAEMHLPRPVTFAEGAYDYDVFLAAAKGLEAEPEGGRRCEACFRLRLGRAAEAAKARGIGLFATTLTVSPHKNAAAVNAAGLEAAGAAEPAAPGKAAQADEAAKEADEAAKDGGLVFLPSDFKKKDGYRRSIALSQHYSLYRQDYCGCAFSKAGGGE